MIVCYVLGANPPLNIIEGYFRRIWEKLGFDKIALIDNPIYYNGKLLESSSRRFSIL